MVEYLHGLRSFFDLPTLKDSKTKALKRELKLLPHFAGVVWLLRDKFVSVKLCLLGIVECWIRKQFPVRTKIWKVWLCFVAAREPVWCRFVAKKQMSPK